MGRSIVIAVGIGVLALCETAWAHPRIADGFGVLRVVVLNQAENGLTPGALRDAEAEAASIFAPAGVRLVWRESKADGADFDVAVMIVSGTRLAGLSPADAESTWGFAITRKDGAGLRGRLVYVRLDQIQRYAADQPVSVPHVCGLVIAHEIGHLLLSAGHSPSGLMRAMWQPESLTDMYFTRAQVDMLHARMAVLNADRTGAGTECVRLTSCGAPAVRQ